jgi:hypothetical protein
MADDPERKSPDQILRERRANAVRERSARLKKAIEEGLPEVVDEEKKVHDGQR